MNLQEAIPLLPCYVAGDLPLEAVPAVEALLAEDGQARALVAQLQEQQRDALSQLCADAPGALKRGRTRTEAAPRPRPMTRAYRSSIGR